jgi:hypothetical protein
VSDINILYTKKPQKKYPKKISKTTLQANPCGEGTSNAHCGCFPKKLGEGKYKYIDNDAKDDLVSRRMAQVIYDNTKMGKFYTIIYY